MDGKSSSVFFKSARRLQWNSNVVGMKSRKMFMKVYVSQCKKTDKNRTIHLNQELTSMHKKVVDNLESINGALLCRNRSIQSEGTFGIMKSNRWYKRIVRKGMKQVRWEIFLVSIGHNLYKYHNKTLRLKKTA